MLKKKVERKEKMSSISLLVMTDSDHDSTQPLTAQQLLASEM
jgi:hypothetical protein